MSGYMVALILCAMIALDIKLIWKRDPDLSAAMFKVSRWVAGIVLVSGLLLLLSPEGLETFPEIFLILYLPYYLLKRRRCLKAIEEISPGFDGHRAVDSLTIFIDFWGVILTFIFGSVVINLLTDPLVLFLPEFKSKLGELLLHLTMSYFLILWLIYQASRKFSSEGFWASLGFRTKNVSFYKTYILPVILGSFFAWISSHVIITRESQPRTPLEDILLSTSSPLLIALFVFFAIFGAPLVEEIMFRGYFFYVLSRNLSKIIAISIVSLVFAVFHVSQYWGDWTAIGVVTILGFALTAVRSLSQTTVASTIMHYVYNAGVTILPIVMLVSSNASYLQYRLNYPNLDYQQKEQLLKQSLTEDPQLADAYNDLAWIYAEQNKNLDEALVLIDKALSFDPASDAFLDTKAEILFKKGDYKESKRYSQKVLDHTFSVAMRELQRQRIDKIKHREKQASPSQ